MYPRPCIPRPSTPGLVLQASCPRPHIPGLIHQALYPRPYTPGLISQASYPRPHRPRPHRPGLRSRTRGSERSDPGLEAPNGQIQDSTVRARTDVKSVVIRDVCVISNHWDEFDLNSALILDQLGLRANILNQSNLASIRPVDLASIRPVDLASIRPVDLASIHQSLVRSIAIAVLSGFQHSLALLVELVKLVKLVKPVKLRNPTSEYGKWEATKRQIDLATGNRGGDGLQGTGRVKTVRWQRCTQGDAVRDTRTGYARVTRTRTPGLGLQAQGHQAQGHQA